MKIGCFALVQPFLPVAEQLKLIKAMGVDYADVTDNHDGGSLGAEYGFAETVSLDSHPAAIRKMAADAGIELTAFCAHANLLDPVSPEIYSTHQIIKAIRLAAECGIDHVITTEGDPKTEFGRNLSSEERIFAIIERLHVPIQWAEELGVKLLIEPHGIVTDHVDQMEKLLEKLGHEDTVGICLDTGNSWLGGGEPIDFIKRFGTRIKHVHWKDMPEEWVEKRGKEFGCGMAVIPLGDGVIDISAIVNELKAVGFDGATTLEIAGEDNIKISLERLRGWIG
ncbi:sugar phosphate isomerase/epimerase family protein [Pontiella agarivorans]|uniref:Sugar phosphate isomerase/epimerase n=1 Tax=Pontiella agarivorans TaxID=3038953 RepID=A0ABU5MXR9_9BACT|nr:sugar phosphate isomerase/epimerase [Pontiella agarivorans]MDZ8118766.1 sugar phosphate isomerase/epimerase [Pontiella agarivorans]